LDHAVSVIEPQSGKIDGGNVLTADIVGSGREMRQGGRQAKFEVEQAVVTLSQPCELVAAPLAAVSV
jgi:hypothetical protein